MSTKLKSRIEELEKSLKDLKLIGVVGSTTFTTKAPLILVEGMEKEVREEDLVAIKNLNGGLILAVCREGAGINDNLRVGSYSPGVAYVRATGRSPSSAKESYHFILSFIGLIEGDGMKTNDLLVAPGSPVYLFRGSEHNPVEYIKPKKCVLGGHLIGERGWRVPFDSTFIPYHIGVFGATGSGKSFLARYLLIPLLKEAGYGVLVLDWAGVDYAPYFKEVVPITDVKCDSDSVISYILDKTNNFGYKTESAIVSAALEDAIVEEWDKLLNRYKGDSGASNILAELERSIKDRIQGDREYSRLKDSEKLAISRVGRGFRKISPDDVKTLMGELEVSQIVPQPGNLLVVDMHGVEDARKLSFFMTLSKYILDEVSKGKNLNLALVIDEAPQYCPFEPKGLRYYATEKIKNMCALGRKHQLCMVLISQGIAGEIGINAAVRRNLNTWFIGQIHPIDLEEAGKRLSPYGIRPETLLYLDPGEFYFIGKMNPSPTPLLISFEIEEGA